MKTLPPLGPMKPGRDGPYTAMFIPHNYSSAPFIVLVELDPDGQLVVVDRPFRGDDGRATADHDGIYVLI